MSKDRLPGLDGLRALAVAAVVLFHAHASWLPGGFLGVDVFFVVSGFLITTLLVREYRRRGHLDLPAFWTRRARRLLPALLLVVLLAPLAARLVETDLLVGIGRQTLGALTFSTNWVEIAAGSDYFHATSPQLFANLWSLAVEEQFYLVWPIVVLVLVRRRRAGPGRALVPLTLAIASAVLMGLHVDPGAPTRVYYGTDTHLVGLMLGAALAFAYAAPGRAGTRTATWRLLHLPVTLWSLVLLLALFVVTDEGSAFTFRAGIPLTSLATAGLILGLVSAPSQVRAVASVRPLVWIGQRSYGIYLWHWPIILLVGGLWPVAPGGTAFVASRVLAVTLTLVVAAASYRYVEVPIRRFGFAATARRVRSTLAAFTPRGLRLAGASTLVASIAYAAVLVTAPADTSTARLLSANAAAAAPLPDASPASASPTASSSPPAAASPMPTDPASVFAMPTGSEIDAYGDSMLVGSLHAMTYYFPNIRLDGHSNRRWSDGLAAVQAKGVDNRRAVVLAFGTNAGADRAAIESTLAALGPHRMVVLVTEHGPFSRVAADNAILRQVASAHDNVGLADWDAALAGTSGQLQSDGIHPSLVGAHLFAKTVRSALADLTARHTGVKPPLPDLPIP
ncbi:MAG TPA: acyltransferase family protein [Phycicoccus sp.]|nr:acyltransferase family protein [Phycicoccus sp.]